LIVLAWAVLLVLLTIAMAALSVWRVRADYSAASIAATAILQRSAHVLSSRATSSIVNAEVLATQCDDYADSHGGRYPADVHTLRDWLYGNGMNVPDDLEEYVYVGSGITRANSDDRIILWFRRPTPPLRQWLVVYKAMSDSGRTRALAASDLTARVNSANDARASLGLPRIDVDSPK